MKALFLVFTLMMSLAHAETQLLEETVYRCKASDPVGKYDISDILVRREKDGKIFADATFKTDISAITYTSEVKYVETPTLTFPSWNGEGVSIITEKKARDFQAKDFTGCVKGSTPDFDFSANLSCERVSSGKPSKV